MTKKPLSPTKAFDKYLRLLEERERQAEAVAVTTGQVVVQPEKDYDKVASGGIDIVAAYGIYRVTKKAGSSISDEDFNRYKTELDDATQTRYTAEEAKIQAEAEASQAKSELATAEKTLVDAQNKANLETRLSEIDKEIEDIKKSGGASADEIETQQQKVDEARKALKFRKERTLEQVEGEIEKIREPFPDEKKFLQEEINSGKQSIVLDSAPLKDESGKLITDETAARKELEKKKGMFKEGEGIRHDVVPIRNKKGKVVGYKTEHTMELKVAQQRLSEIEKLEKLKTYHEELKKLDELKKKGAGKLSPEDQAKLKELEAERTGVQEKLKNLEKTPTVAEAEKAVNEAKAKSASAAEKANDATKAYDKALKAEKDVVSRQPKGVEIERQPSRRTSTSTLEPEPMSKAIRKAGFGRGLIKWGGRALAGAAAAYGLYNIIQGLNPQELAVEAPIVYGPDGQPDPSAQAAGTVSQEDMKYFTDKEYLKKYSAALLYYGIYPMGPDAKYLPDFVRQEAAKILTRMKDGKPYVDVAELELRRSLVAAYDQNSEEMNKGLQLIEKNKPAFEVLDYYCEHGGKDKNGVMRPAEYWRGRAQPEAEKGLTGKGMQDLLAECLPYYDEVKKKKENASDTPGVEEDKTSTPSTDGAGKNPAQRKGRRDLSAPKPKVGAIKPSNTTSALASVSTNITAGTKEQDASREYGSGRGSV
ncbi:MAG: hypothetical protein IJY92_07005 [Alphaproteobacteria bacterium]|nr:hypothetical protein [Alphaproteobacteria bacterium]